MDKRKNGKVGGRIGVGDFLEWTVKLKGMAGIVYLNSGIDK